MQFGKIALIAAAFTLVVGCAALTTHGGLTRKGNGGG